MPRFHLARLSFAKEKAAMLKASLAAVGVDARLTRCRQVMAVLYGYGDFHELRKVTEEQAHPPSPLREDIAAEDVDVLSRSFGIDGRTAWSVLAVLRPRALRTKGGISDLDVLRAVTAERPGDVGQAEASVLERLVSTTPERIDGAPVLDGGRLRADLANVVERTIVAQLGRTWNGPSGASVAAKAFVAMAAVRLVGDGGSEAAAAARRLSEVVALLPFADDPIELTEAASALVDVLREFGGRRPDVVSVAERHGFETTALMGVYAFVRRETNSIWPSAEFLWLKTVDPVLWNALNAVGLLMTVPIALGPMSHFLEEQAAGEPLRTPATARAMDALEAYLREAATKDPVAAAADPRWLVLEGQEPAGRRHPDRPRIRP